MELFPKVVYCWELLTNFVKSSIANVWLAQEYVSVLVPFVTRKGPKRCLTVNFGSSLGPRKRALKLLVTFPSSILAQAPWLVIIPIHYCDNIGQLFFQFFWVCSFSQAAIVNFVFTKIAKICNECTTCACNLVYSWA